MATKPVSISIIRITVHHNTQPWNGLLLQGSPNQTLIWNCPACKSKNHQKIIFSFDQQLICWPNWQLIRQNWFKHDGAQFGWPCTIVVTTQLFNLYNCVINHEY